MTQPAHRDAAGQVNVLAPLDVPQAATAASLQDHLARAVDRQVIVAAEGAQVRRCAGAQHRMSIRSYGGLDQKLIAAELISPTPRCIDAASTAAAISPRLMRLEKSLSSNATNA